MPKRIQLQRVAGWRIADYSTNYVIVDRRSRWGNPFEVVRASSTRNGPLDIWAVRFRGSILSRFDIKTDAMEDAVDRFRAAVTRERAPYVPDLTDIWRELRGKDIACWCPVDQPCHGDVYLRAANSRST